MKIRAILTLATLAAVASCSHQVNSAHEPAFGASVAAMHEAQAVSHTAQAGAPEGSGAAGALAQERYKRGQTRPLLPTATSLTNTNE